MSPTNKLPVALDDILWGVPAIAEALNRTPRQVQHLIDIGVIGVTRLAPKTIVTTRTQLGRDVAGRISGEKSN